MLSTVLGDAVIVRGVQDAGGGDADERHWVRRFGARLRVLRLRAGLSQSQLAARLPATIQASQVSRWERGETFPSHANRCALAAALGVPEEALFVDLPDLG